MDFSKNLAFGSRETNFKLLSLHCSDSIENAVPYFNYVWMFESKFFKPIFLESQFFSESPLVQVYA